MSRPFPDVPLDVTVLKYRLEDSQRQAKVDHALRQAGVSRQGWLSRRSGWLLCQMGRRLVAVGGRLKQYGVPQAMPSGALQDA